MVNSSPFVNKTGSARGHWQPLPELARANGHVQPFVKNKMFELDYNNTYPPTYMTKASAAADLRASESVTLPAHKHYPVATGVRIKSVDWSLVPDGSLPNLLVRARSGLASKHGITLLNGVGLIDADYRDEIKVLLWNTSDKDFAIVAGDRIAQISLCLNCRLPLPCKQSERAGGFGSTGV